MLVLVGIALVAYGGFQLRTLTWATVAGHVDACTSRAIADDDVRGLRSTCVVAWDDGGVFALLAAIGAGRISRRDA